MRTLVHLSDLHFGRIDHALIEPLVATIHEMRPDVVAVSGDLTQRARSWQFEEARRFLDRLPAPQLVVPGNHDVPLHNFFARFLRPLDKYRFYITPDTEPFYSDDEIAIAGINTARSLTRKYGRINEEQMRRVQDRLCQLKDNVTKIVMTHHPFDLPEGIGENELVGRAAMAMEVLARCGADLLLAGHLHISHTGHTAKRYKTAGHSALVVQAGTATSTRGRGETNSFNRILISHPHITVERFAWQSAQNSFANISTENFQHTPDGWARLADGIPPQK